MKDTRNKTAYVCLECGEEMRLTQSQFQYKRDYEHGLCDGCLTDLYYETIEDLDFFE